MSRTVFHRLAKASMLLIVALGCFSAHAANLYWDGGTTDIVANGDALSAGGAGNWNTTIKNWDTGVAAHVAWINANNDTAIFGGTAGTVTLTAPITVGGVTFVTTAYTLTASSTNTLNFAAGDNTIGLNGVAAATITGAVAGGSSSNMIFRAINRSTAGTITFNGASSGGWQGTTTIDAGTTLTTTTTSGNVNQVLNNTSGITINGGTIQFNRATNAQLNAISDTAAIGVNGGGTLSVTSADAGGLNAIETVGAVTVNSGQMNFNWTNGASSGAQMILSGLTVTSPSAVTFSGALGSTGRWKVTGKGTTTAGEIIGAWATTGAANGIAAQTDYAVYASDFIASAGITASDQSTWSTTTAATSNYTMSALASATLDATRNINTLRSTNNSVTVTAASPDIALSSHNLSIGDVVTFSAGTMPTGLTAGTPYYVVATGSGTIQVSATAGGGPITPTTAGATVVAAGAIQVSSGKNLGTTGILNGSATTLNILQSAGGGTVTLPTTTAGKLYVTSGAGAITISAPITNNGVGVLTLVKSGANTLTLSGTNSYTGGTIINAGTLTYTADAALGASGSRNVTFGGTGTLTGFDGSSLGQLSVNAGAAATISGNNITFATASGSGNLAFGNAAKTLTLVDASSFSGNLRLIAGNNGPVIKFSSLSDASGAGNLQFSAGSGDSNQRVTFQLYNDAGPLTFDNRQIEFLPKPTNWSFRAAILENNNANASNKWVINTDLLNQTDRDHEFVLQGSNTGNNEFNGSIGNSTRGTMYNGTGVLKLYKTGAGKWIVSGSNTFTGTLLINQGTLSVGTINSSTVAGPLGQGSLIQLGGRETIVNGTVGVTLNGNNSGTLEYTGNGQTSNRTFQIGDDTAADTGGGVIINNGGGALIFNNTPNFNSTIAGVTGARTLTFGGTNTANNEIQGAVQDNSGTGKVNVGKSGAGTWILSGANSYTGTTSITGGALFVNNTHGSAATPVDNYSVTGGTDSATLAGSGTIFLATGKKITASGTVAKNGIIAPGGGTIDSLTVAATDSAAGVVFGANSTFQVDFTGGSINSDQLRVVTAANTANVGGTLDLSSVSDTLNLVGTGTGSGSYTIATFATLTGTFNNVLINGLATQNSNPLADNYADVNYNANSITVDIANAAVPEPTSLTLLALGAIGCLARRPRSGHR